MNWSRSALFGAGLWAAIGAASAADLPYRAAPPPPPPPPAFTWTGFYAGLNAGGVLRDSWHASIGAPVSVLSPGVPRRYPLGDWGAIGGGQVGFNYQFSWFVLGAEADIQGTTLDASPRVVGPAATGVFKTSVDYLGTVRARAGFVYPQRALWYITGGLIYGQTTTSNSLTITAPIGPFVPGDTFFGSTRKSSSGWTLGGGVEYALTPNWSAKLEYLFYDLGGRSVTAVGPGGALAPSVPHTERGDIIRVGANYKFW